MPLMIPKRGTDSNNKVYNKTPKSASMCTLWLESYKSASMAMSLNKDS